MSKTLIGGTRQGIVLDMKVGPSVHLQDYASVMLEHFISYSRGGSTAANLPENQCMGTLALDDGLRLRYAEVFNSHIKENASYNINTMKVYNLITGYHGDAWKNAHGFDVAKMPPIVGDDINSYSVSEPSEWSHGPFRVYKEAYSQTNRRGSHSPTSRVHNLAIDVAKQEFSNIEDREGYIAKLKAIAQQI